jgi:drug/metabolite transporter (DMT)-like permease
MRAVQKNPSEGALAAAAPGLVAALAFASVSVFGKASFIHGADIATFLVTRGVIGSAIIWLWLKGTPRTREFTRAEKAVALALGLLFAANVYTLFRAIAIIPVGIVELTYFLYPMVTGIVGALTGLDRLSGRGVTAALVAFAGLALMIGAHTDGLSWVGLAFAGAAAMFRSAMLLLTRAKLPTADPRDVSWYTMIGSSAVFVVLLLASGEMNFPRDAIGWGALVWASLAAAIALIAMFASARRIGPFRTALIMNAEPVAVLGLSWLVLGEALNATQWVGAAIMIGSLFWFQLRR